MPDQTVISNTSPLFYLHAVGQLDLLRQLFGRIITPPAVVAELAAGVVKGHDVPDIAELPWIEVRSPSEATDLEGDLGAGETEAIALALEVPGSLLILDDFAARQVAAARSLRLTGTLGVVLQAKNEGCLAEVTPVMKALSRTTMRMSDALVQLVLTEAGELKAME